MKEINLNSDEKFLLIKYFKTSSVELIKLKSQAIRMRDKGFQVNDIAYTLLKSRRTIERWITDFKSSRISSIFSGLVNNENASKLTVKQKAEIKEVLSKPPGEYDLPYVFWDVPQLKKYIEAHFGVVYQSDTSYHFLLKFSNLTFKYPEKFDTKRNEELINIRMSEIEKEILPYLNNESWEIFALDEVGLQIDSLTRKAWLQRGKKTIVKTDRSVEKQNYIGMLNQKTNKCHIYEISSGNQEEVIRWIYLQKNTQIKRYV